MDPIEMTVAMSAALSPMRSARQMVCISLAISAIKAHRELRRVQLPDWASGKVRQ